MSDVVFDYIPTDVSSAASGGSLVYLAAMSNATLDLKQFIRDIPDFPKPGILFRDITPLLGHAAALRETVRRMAEPFRDKKINAVVAAEARGFIFAAPMAIELGAGFVPV